MTHSRLPLAALLMAGLLVLALAAAACGEAATPVPPTAAPTATTAAVAPTATTAAQPTETPTAMAEEPTEAMTSEEDPLMKYAADHAGGPGAIFVGDISQLAGPAPMTPAGEPDADLGDSEGNVPLSALEDHLWLYESDYYQSLVEKANLTSPTE